MAGTVIRAVRMRQIDFGTLAVGLSQEIVLADMVETFGWREIVVLLKLHANGIAPGAGFITIKALPQSTSREDPGLIFVDRSGLASGSLTFDGTSPSPSYFTFTMSTGKSPLLQLTAQSARTAGGALKATISIDVSLKGGTGAQQANI